MVEPLRPMMVLIDETHEHEFLSACCGAPRHSDCPMLCAQCHDHSGFECECGEVKL